MNKLNIRSDSSDWRGAILSNLAYTPFVVCGITFPSVESPLQGIKFQNETRRSEVFAMDGMAALRAGREITRSASASYKKFVGWVYWNNQKIRYNSTDHRLLIAMFIHEKIRQNPKVQEALLATTGDFIYHDVGKENPQTSLPEKFYIQILLSERDMLRKLIAIA